MLCNLLYKLDHIFNLYYDHSQIPLKNNDQTGSCSTIFNTIQLRKNPKIEPYTMKYCTDKIKRHPYTGITLTNSIITHEQIKFSIVQQTCSQNAELWELKTLNPMFELITDLTNWNLESNVRASETLREVEIRNRMMHNCKFQFVR